MKQLVFLDGNGTFIQADSSQDLIAYTCGVIAALGALGYNVLDNVDEEDVRWKAWKDGKLCLIFFEVGR